MELMSNRKILSTFHSFLEIEPQIHNNKTLLQKHMHDIKAILYSASYYTLDQRIKSTSILDNISR